MKKSKKEVEYVEQCIERLILLYQNDIYRYCLRLTDNRQDAEELFQETFIKVIQLKHRLLCGDTNTTSEEQQTYDDKNRKFLFGIATNLWKNEYRKKARRKRHILQEDGENKIELVPSGQEVEELVVKKEMERQLLQFVHELPEKLNIVICMYYTANMKIEEIAKVLHIPKGTVNSRLHLAKKRLRAEMEAKGYEFRI